MNVARGVMLTFDYQFLANPAHNADRGRYRSSPGGCMPSP
jgi:hypothetical protein